MQNKNKELRKVDIAAHESSNWINRQMVMINKKNVKTWKAVFIIAFIGGLLTALIWMVQINIQTSSFADSKKETKEREKSEKFVPGEIIVQMKKGTSKKEEEELFKKSDLKVKEEISQIKTKLVSVPEDKRGEILEKLSKNSKVEFAENNYLAEGGIIPDDPKYPSQWHLPKISAPIGWDLNTGSEGVVIGVIDSGIDPTHPDISSKLVPGYNFLSNNTDTHDVLGHGTKVSGTASAISNNSVGVAGVTWKNKIMPLVVLDSTNYASYYNISRAITYAADHGAKVLNISIGGTSSSSTMQSAVDYAWQKGIITVACAHNYSTDTPYYPAALQKVIAVSATTSTDIKASFSNFGSWIDVSAPGSGILTTTNGGGYGSVSGTSFSSPITAGALALIFSINPNFTPDQAQNVLFTSADDLGEAGFDTYYGWGRVNIGAAAQLASSGQITPPLSDTVIPQVSITFPQNGATVSGLINVSADASDNVGVIKVEFYSNNQLIGSDNSLPYSVPWDSTKSANGSNQITAYAYDAALNKGTSTPITVTVSNQGDIQAPTVIISSPKDGSTVSGLVNISASATDNIGVTKMELYIDGKLTKSYTAGTASYSWNTKKVSVGNHSISFKCYDAAGNVGNASVSIVVSK